MIRGSDGLEYADEAALLLREPINNAFNSNVRWYRRAARQDAEATRLDGIVPGPLDWTEAKVRQYIEGFVSVCPQGDPGPCLNFSIAHDAGLEAAGFRSLRQAVAYAGKRFADRIDRGAFTVFNSKPPNFIVLDDTASDNFGVATIDPTSPA